MRKLDHEKIIRMCRDGMSTREISKELGYSQGGVCYVTKRARDRGELPMSDNKGGARRVVDHDEVLRLHREGVKQVDIATRLNTNPGTVTGVIGRARGRGDLPPVREQSGLAMMRTMGVRMGPLQQEMDKRLTRGEWDFLLDKINRVNVTISDVIIDLIIESAGSDT